MTVSDESAGSPDPQPKKKHVCIFRSNEEWKRIQIQYETAQPRISQRKLAALYGIPPNTLMRRAAVEHWSQKDKIMGQATETLEQASTKAVAELIPGVVSKITKQTMDTLEPWIAKRQRIHIRSQVIRGTKTLKRIDRLTNAKKALDAKNEAFAAKVVESTDNVVRRNLGMSDGKQPGGSLSLRILTGQTAVELTA